MESELKWILEWFLDLNNQIAEIEHNRLTPLTIILISFFSG
jgi:hypothetical protein